MQPVTIQLECGDGVKAYVSGHFESVREAVTAAEQSLYAAAGVHSGLRQEQIEEQLIMDAQRKLKEDRWDLN